MRERIGVKVTTKASRSTLLQTIPLPLPPTIFTQIHADLKLVQRLDAEYHERHALRSVVTLPELPQLIQHIHTVLEFNKNWNQANLITDRYLNVCLAADSRNLHVPPTLDGKSRRLRLLPQPKACIG